jgi:hypothetical protein
LTSSTGTYSFDVVYEQAGANEVVSLTYTSDDLDDYASLVLDRNSASQESDVHLTITDNQLNIDPTSEDIIIFDVTTDSEGMSFTARSATDTYNEWSNTFDDNGKLIINYNTQSASTPVLINKITGDDATANKKLVFYEYGENSGIFVNTDDNNESNLEVNIDAKRGTTATFSYNDSAQSFVVANDFGVITMDASSVGDEWNSGEAIAVTLIDQDLNKNTNSDEDLLLVNTTNGQILPSLQIGSPLTVDTTDSEVVGVSSYSKIGYFTNAALVSTQGNTLNYTITTGYTETDLDAIETVNTYFNWDFTSFKNGNSTNTVDRVCLTDSSGRDLACGTTAKGITEITNPAYAVDASALTVTVSTVTDLGTPTSFTALPFVADVFSYGTGVNNAIYRLQLEESGDNTATFEGTVEYEMLNQLNINQRRDTSEHS